VFLHHGVIYTAHIHFHIAFVYADGGNVLLAAGFGGVGNQSVHFQTAAVGLDTGIMDHFYNITAMGTDIKLDVLHSVIPP
jgi:hypothetical protein